MSSTAKATSTNTKSDKIVKTVNILRCKVVNIDKLQDLLGHSIIILRGLICEPDQITALTGRRRGRCKWFNVAKGWGFITPNDGGPDVFVHQSVIQMNGFRSLGDEEEVEFECKVSDKGLEATLVTGVEGLECKGSHRRPISRKKFKKVRCYNCGEFANHIAAKCNMGPQPKKCHHCKAVDHLIADCPVSKLKTKKSKQQQSVSSDGDEDEQIEDELDDKSEDKPEVKCENKGENKSLDEVKDVDESSELTTNESTSLKATETRPTSSCCSTVKEDPTGSTQVTESPSSLSSTCLTQSETSMLTLSLPVPEPESSEVNDDCCVIIMNKLNVETSEMGSEDDVSLVTVETQSTSSSVSSDHGKEVRSDSGIIVRDDDCMNGRSNSRNSCDINNNNNNDSNNDDSKTNETNDTDHSNDIMDSKIIANNIKNVENCNNSFNNNNNNLNLNNKLFSTVESLTTGNNLLNTESDKHSIASSLIQLPQPESS
ncbi:putative uncharacterized protein DDB_G0272516 isoform X1 [Tetranychus urticae]|uniref:CSD domain-containing protein n=1 Tax=Tetranychus urticae TaxID=32264 RepID=T1KM74_TETUR|nr:putative uncharacterized protein DDB_G0272516 isoform X1 [Tetranychus urticae]